MALPGPTRIPIFTSPTVESASPSPSSDPPRPLLPLANKAGPYICGGHASNIPYHSFPGHTNPTNAWRQFLLASRARHHSYWSHFAHLGPKAGRLKYQLTYNYTMVQLNFALLQTEPTDINEQNQLIETEQHLTYVTFKRFPELWEMCFIPNTELLEDLGEYVRTPNRVQDPDVVLGRIYEALESCWIVLDDPVDILNGNDPNYTTWGDLEQGKLELVNDMNRIAEYLEGVVLES